LARSTLTRRSKLRRVSSFSGTTPQQAGSSSPEMPPSSTVARFRLRQACGRRPKGRPPSAPLRLRPEGPRHRFARLGRLRPEDLQPHRARPASVGGLKSPPTSACPRLPALLPSAPSCGSSPGSSCILAPIRLGLAACAVRPPPVGQSAEL
jgi:hypothetical protein